MPTEPASTTVRAARGNDPTVALATEIGRPVLTVQNLTTELRLEGGPIRAVDDVSFELRAGETLSIVGESGCGKSMTALSIMGLLPDRLAGLPKARSCSRTSVISLDCRKRE